jgi:hypothetical protein
MSHSSSCLNPWKGFVLGVLGSVAGLLAMQYYWDQVAPAVDKALPKPDTEQGKERAPQPVLEPLREVSIAGPAYREDESSTAALGRLIYARLTGREPRSKEGASILSYLVHWVYGMLQGGVYGALSGRGPGLDLRGGALFGANLWLFGDEVLVPLLGLQSGPAEASTAQHLNRLGAHLFYGAGTAAVTQLLKRLV